MTVEQQLPPPPKKHEGFMKFGHSHQQQQGPDMSGINSEMNTLGRRLRLLEEGFSNLRRFFQVTEENIIAKNKHYSAEIKTVTSDITELRKEIQELKDKMLLIIKELQTVARKDEVKVLERYINLWNPVRFVTQNEIDGIINEVLEKKSNRKV
ncbi:hypothetical protein CMO83_01320 [Candidatus Woesearchaeota archaeon]|jgi:hypothetical protein|nr:hypothetical protein [Candidatus Woesearchaeota archaeon]|tara:strand:- start:550 stop:1008 length:459 start_codon:yes stop_codon:yes gene_type:complete